MKYDAYTIEDFLTDESFVNYCLGTSQEDVVFWENLLHLHPELEERLNKAKKLFFFLAVQVDPIEKQIQLDRLKATIESLEFAEDQEIEMPVKKLSSRISWISAAAAILICIGSYALLHKKEKSTIIPLYTANAKSIPIKTAYNERKTVTLRDGSKVIMNGLTELKLDEHYNENSRVLWLHGEAYFEVAKNKDKPFIVITGKTTTTAIGTAFKINNYSNIPETSVMLSTGKVSIGELVDQKIVGHLELIPGEQVRVAGHKLTKSTFNPEEIDNWTARKLVFAMASLKEIKAVLKEIYGIEIRSKNQPNKPIAFTGTFINESLTEVLKAIGFANHFTYHINNDIVTLTFEKKQPPK